MRSSPAGVEISATAPTKDVDGEPLGRPPVLLAYLTPACEGPPAGRASAGEPIMLPASGPAEVRVVATTGELGEPSAPVAYTPRPLPPAPQAPLAFVGPEGSVEISWLPPEASHVRLYRDGVLVGRYPAGSAMATDDPGPGVHRYTIAAEGPDFVTAPSAFAKLKVSGAPK